MTNEIFITHATTNTAGYDGNVDELEVILDCKSDDITLRLSSGLEANLTGEQLEKAVLLYRKLKELNGDANVQGTL